MEKTLGDKINEIKAKLSTLESHIVKDRGEIARLQRALARMRVQESEEYDAQRLATRR